MCRSVTTRRGAPRKYDHAKIKKGIQEGRSNTDIALEVGCSVDCVRDLRWKMDPNKLMRYF